MWAIFCVPFFRSLGFLKEVVVYDSKFILHYIFLKIFLIIAKPVYLQHFLKPAITNMGFYNLLLAITTPKGSGLTLDPPKNSIGPGTELTVVIRSLEPPFRGFTFMIQVDINLAQLY